ncbi:adenylate/guanylate cyclase domain-containing protein [Bosea sp. F3-2]|uniref:adenylate/guanylate cyclase domain-containing protein n=1 Tax=Bosea sp. F3-2 TaxID=2599640 RepID=UPI0016551281|nr:adenylate/guanylate cyclase domain-containing protein [Bosea sp. F3-2]
MRCAACDVDNLAAAKFCGACGASLGAPCPRCGHSNRPNSRFCIECGEQLAGPTPAFDRDAKAPAPSPSSYTPPHLAEKILASRGGVEGERKQVTVLFADIKGSTELIRELDVEEAQTLLDGALKVMMDAVHRYEGTVSRALGDGIMALFGAPIAHEDHALRACYAALALQDGMRRYTEQVRRAHGTLVEARVGLNSGEVVVRMISDDLHMDYSAMGQTVHLASRLEQLAREGSCLLAADTLGLVEGYVQVRTVGPVAIKGLDGPVELFELLGIGVARTRLQAMAARGLTRFVGRDAEMSAIHSALEPARAGHGQVIALVGEPGVGKSRLVWEVTHSHRTREWLVLDSGSVSYGKATSWLPVIEMLKAHCRIEPRDGSRMIREKLTGKLLTLDRELEPDLPAFLALLDAPVEDEAWQALDPPKRRRQTLDALKRLLLRESREQPLLLVFEDLHWIDSETKALLDSLVEGLPTARILLLVTYRPECSHSWGGKTYYTQLRIDPFGEDGAEALLDALLGTAGDGRDGAASPLAKQDAADGRKAPPPRDLKRLLIRRTEGNPFFLEECVRTLAETGALVGERGAYRLAAEVAEIRVPATVQAVLAARIDRLPADEKRLLQTSAVIGKDVPFALLRAITVETADATAHPSEEEILRVGLAHLQAAEFLYETNLFPVLEFTFKHALTHEVAYGSLLQERRKALHARIVGAIETLYAERLAEHVERLAHHAQRGECWEKVVSYARQAGHKGVARSANREAAVFFEQALAALAHRPETRVTQEQAVDLRFDLRQPLLPLGEFQQILDHLRKAEAIAESLGDQRRLARTLSWLSYSYCFTLGDNQRAIETGQRALAIGRTLDDVPLRVLATFYLAFAHWQQGDYRQAIDGFKWIVATLQGELIRERFGMTGYPAVLARGLLALCLGDTGEFAEGRTHAADAIQLAEAFDQPFSQAALRTWLAHFYITQGDLPAAMPLLEQCCALADRWNLPRQGALASSLLGVAHALDGRPTEAVPFLEQAMTQLSSKTGSAEIRLGISACEGFLLAGRLQQATPLADRALNAARESRGRAYEAQALRLLGEIAARRDPPHVDEAESRYGEAQKLAEELDMRPLRAQCHLGLGRLYRRTGRTHEAHIELRAAVQMLRAMEMKLWLPEGCGASTT